MDAIPLVLVGMLSALLGIAGGEDHETEDRIAWCGVGLLAIVACIVWSARG